MAAKVIKYAYELTEESLRKAENLLRSFIKTNAKSDDAYAFLANVLYHQVIMQYVQDKDGGIISESYQSAVKALSINDFNISLFPVSFNIGPEIILISPNIFFHPDNGKK